MESSDDDEEEEDDVNTGSRRKRRKVTHGKSGTPRITTPLLTASTRLTQMIASTRAEYSEQPSSAPSESEEDDTYGGQKGRAFAKKQRRALQSATSGRGTPNMSEVRFSTRRAAKVTNYNDDDNFGISDEEEETTPSYYYTYEDEGPAIDSVLNFRLKEGAGT